MKSNFLLLAGGAFALLCSGLYAQPVVSYQPANVRIAGVTAGKDVVWLGAARVAHGYDRDVAIGVKRVTDEDRDGSVSIDLKNRLPLHSVWIAVDLHTGRTTVSSPHAAGPNHRTVPLNDEELRELVNEGVYGMFLLVRPGVGAWTLDVQDSGLNDSDQTPDRKVRLDVSRLQPLGDSPPTPRHITPNDVAFMVDPLELTVVELRRKEK